MFASGMTNITDVITTHATERPWAVAILDDSGAMHYQTFEALVWAAAWHFHRRGIRAGDAVGVTLPQSALQVVAVYGLARMGAISVPMPLSDPIPLRGKLTERFNVRAVVAMSPEPVVSGVPTIELNATLLREAPTQPVRELRAAGGSDAWSVRRTSGTTGEPKGIARTHNAALGIWEAHAADYPIEGNRSLCILDLSTAFGLTVVERTFYRGATLVIGPTAMSAVELLGRIDTYAITHLYLTPNFLSALLSVLPNDQCRCPSLREVLVAGMAMPEVLRAEIRRRMTPNLIIQYGANEIGAMTNATLKMQEQYPETVGAMRPRVEVQIVDEHDVPVAAGEAGIVRARAPWMATGYMNLDSSAQSNFRNGWLYPGDIGVLNSDGMLFLKGRVDDMMNFDGIKILPTDIEEALMAHPAVVDAVAFPVLSAQHHHIPAASVVVRQTISPEDLLAYCRQRLGVRSPVLISVEGAFPRNAMGKVVRRELADKLAKALVRKSAGR